MSLQIRALRPNDRAGLEGVLRSDDTFRDDEVDVALELIDDALDKAESDYWFRLAEAEGELAGYICFGPTPMTESTYDLYWVVTHAAHRGKGVAKTLIRHMEEWLLENKGRSQVRVETSQSEGYGAARRLYAGLGYPEAARFENFYKEGDDLIVFYKCL